MKQIFKHCGVSNPSTSPWTSLITTQIASVPARSSFPPCLYRAWGPGLDYVSPWYLSGEVILLGNWPGSQLKNHFCFAPLRWIVGPSRHVKRSRPDVEGCPTGNNIVADIACEPLDADCSHRIISPALRRLHACMCPAVSPLVLGQQSHQSSQAALACISS